MNIVSIFLSIFITLSLTACKSGEDSGTTTETVATPTPAPTPAYFPIEVRSPGVDVTRIVGTSFTYVIGGGKAPYTFLKLSGPGDIGTLSGVFTAGFAAGNTLIQVSDSSGLTQQVTVRVNPALSITPQVVYLPSNALASFVAQGGVPRYTYEVISGSGSINSIGLFSAPAAPGISKIRVYDSQGNIVLAQVETNYPPTITPSTLTMSRGSSAEFKGNFGFPPYQYSVTELVSEEGVAKCKGSSTQLGSIEITSGLFTAPQIEKSLCVVVTDRVGQVAESRVSVVSQPLILNAANLIVEVNKTVNIRASGGLPPYSYSKIYGEGTLLPTGTYYTPGARTDALVRVTDAENNTAQVTIQVNDPLSLSPTTIVTVPNKPATVTASGGSPPYSFFILSGGGSISNAQDNPTGSYVAPSTTGQAVIRVIDSLNSTADVSVSINSEIQISPAAPLISVGNTVTFIGSGGIPPFEFNLLSGPGTINPATGKFTASSDEIDAPTQSVVEVRDSRNTVKQATITTNPKLRFLEPSLFVKTGFQKTISGEYGVPPYTLRFAKGGSLIGSQITNTNAVMRYQPGLVSEDKIELLQIIDSLGNSVNKEASIASGLLSYYDPSRSRILTANVAPTSMALSLGSDLGVVNRNSHFLNSTNSILIKNAQSCSNYESYDINGRYLVTRIDDNNFSVKLNQNSKSSVNCNAPFTYDLFGNHASISCPVSHSVPLLNLKTYATDAITMSCNYTNAPIFAGSCGGNNSNCNDPYSLILSRAKASEPINRDMTIAADLTNEENSAITVEMWFKWNGDRSPEGTVGFNGTLLGFDNYNVSFMTIQSPGGYTATALCYNTSISANDCFGMRDPDPLITNRWAHFVFVIHNGDVTKNKIYINGAAQSLSTLSSQLTSFRYLGYSMKVGVNYNDAGTEVASPFRIRGNVGVMRVYNKELNANEIFNNYQEFKPLYLPVNSNL